MDINHFIEKFAEIWDDTDPAEFKPDTHFKNLDEWSSLIALSIIAFADEEYEVTLRGDDIRGVQSVQDLFDLIKSKS